MERLGGAALQWPGDGAGRRARCALESHATRSRSARQGRTRRRVGCALRRPRCVDMGEDPEALQAARALRASARGGQGGASAWRLRTNRFGSCSRDAEQMEPFGRFLPAPTPPRPTVFMPLCTGSAPAGARLVRGWVGRSCTATTSSTSGPARATALHRSSCYEGSVDRRSQRRDEWRNNRRDHPLPGDRGVRAALRRRRTAGRRWARNSQGAPR